MSTPLTLSARELRSTIATYSDLLRSHKEVINRLNVYPVPDGDTGTNMTLTIESVAAELGPLADDAEMEAVCKAIAHGSLMGARGNSGVILSQMLRGLVAKFPIKGDVSADLLAESLENADVLARQAVVRIVEGTMLSIARAAAEGARAHCETLIELVRSARDRAKDALALTPEQLPVLKQAGVVDSGGTGLLLLFDALCSVVAHDPLPVAPSAESIVVHIHEETEVRESSIADLRYEVMYFLDAEDDKMHGFREVWSGIGDSIVIVGGDGLYNCHIHTDDIGAAVEAALDAGRPREIRVTDLSEQVIEERWVREGSAEQGDVVLDEAPATSVVAVRRRRRRRSHLSLARRSCPRRRGPVDEPLDGGPRRRGRGDRLIAGRPVAEQQKHPTGGRSGQRSASNRPSPSCPRIRSSRVSPRCSNTTPTRAPRRTRFR